MKGNGMNDRERRWYEGKHGRHPPNCSCVTCTEKKVQNQKNIEKDLQGNFVHTIGKYEDAKKWGKDWVKKWLKVDKSKEKDKYICPNPDCLKESLSYNEDKRLFICSECGREYTLVEYKE